MAPPSPRRSARPRGPNSQSQQSSSTSSLSSRAERNTRSIIKNPSAKSTPSASLSSEPLEDLEDTIVSRRRTRGQEEIRDKTRLDIFEMANGSDDIQEDDESVRCVCGFDEYPGPPPLGEESRHTKPGIEGEFFTSVELSDEVSGLFVQCDICKVWQHGACVGIFTEESSPDEYFCEQCRKDLHKIHTASNGQRYSHYLPLNRPSRTTSRATSLVKDGTRSPKDSTKSGRASSATQASKRRSTMNSRDAAYDEEELIRRAIEASKEETAPESTDGGTRRAKRGRSDSEENRLSQKRQRTASSSVSPPPDKFHSAIEDDSEDEAAAQNGSSKKPPRPSRIPREKSEREERDRQRAEAANKRKGRADRRRAEDSDPSEEMPLAAARAVVKQSMEPQAPVDPPPSSAPTPDTPPANQTTVGSSHKKSSRNHQKRGKGRNQYTKDREENEESPARSMSRDTPRNPDENGPSTIVKHTVPDHSRQGPKTKNGVNSKVSMGEMKRRVAAFLEFISKTQVELAGEAFPSFRSSTNTSQEHSPRDILAIEAPKIQVNGGASDQEKSSPVENGSSTESPVDSKDFRELDCVEMMDVLTRDLLKWQKSFSA